MSVLVKQGVSYMNRLEILRIIKCQQDLSIGFLRKCFWLMMHVAYNLFFHLIFLDSYIPHIIYSSYNIVKLFRSEKIIYFFMENLLHFPM